MFSSSVLAVSHHPQVRRLVTTNPASRRLVGRFVAGDDLDTAMAPIRALVERGLLVTVDHLGEDVTDPTDAAATRDAYVTLLGRLDDLGLAPAVEVSVKLSALGQACRARLVERPEVAVGDAVPAGGRQARATIRGRGRRVSDRPVGGGDPERLEPLLHLGGGAALRIVAAGPGRPRRRARRTRPG